MVADCHKLWCAPDVAGQKSCSCFLLSAEFSLIRQARCCAGQSLIAGKSQFLPLAYQRDTRIDANHVLFFSLLAASVICCQKSIKYRHSPRCALHFSERHPSFSHVSLPSVSFPAGLWLRSANARDKIVTLPNCAA